MRVIFIEGVFEATPGFHAIAASSMSLSRPLGYLFEILNIDDALLAIAESKDFFLCIIDARSGHRHGDASSDDALTLLDRLRERGFVFFLWQTGHVPALPDNTPDFIAYVTPEGLSQAIAPVLEAATFGDTTSRSLSRLLEGKFDANYPRFLRGRLDADDFVKKAIPDRISTFDYLKRAVESEFELAKVAGRPEITELQEDLPGAPSEESDADFDVAARDPALALELDDDALPTRPAAPSPSPVRRRRTRSPKRTIQTGFSQVETPQRAVDPDSSLTPGRHYYFWFQIGGRVVGAIDRVPVDVSAAVSEGEEVVVVLFSQRGGIRLVGSDAASPADGATAGELEGRIYLTASGSQVVAQPHAKAKFPAKLRKKRLFFQVVTPDEEGVYWLRCNVYHRGGVLVQSFNVRVPVCRAPATLGPLETTQEYVLSHSLAPSVLKSFGEHRLCVMLNDSGGTHGFRFYGTTDVRGTAELDELTIQGLLDRARAVYQRASWGNDAAYVPGAVYRYEQPAGFQEFAEDIIAFAKVGFKIWADVAGSLAQGDDGDIRRQRLQELMRAPGGRVQLALKRSARHVLPISLFYDHPLDTMSPEPLKLCSTFKRQVGNSPLNTDCFTKGCPNYGDSTVVCPSGFWGFRHLIGLPRSLGDNGDYAAVRPTTDEPRLFASSWRGAEFILRDAHFLQLANWLGSGFIEARTRADTLARLIDCSAHVVYFYCHGGFDADDDPFILVGADEKTPITVDNLANLNLNWRNTSPLVFVNGCHTAALEPEHALQFVDEFVRQAFAVGVIGTEITVFEPLAVDFASKFLQKYQTGRDIGQAIQETRLELLGEQLNPLGLLYIPYVLSTVTMTSRPHA